MAYVIVNESRVLPRLRALRLSLPADFWQQRGEREAETKEERCRVL